MSLVHSVGEIALKMMNSLWVIMGKCANMAKHRKQFKFSGSVQHISSYINNSGLKQYTKPQRNTTSAWLWAPHTPPCPLLPKG